ncbi:predicted protein [Lichtheimia corymbifera JMRC:FSU:9682]|uniref:Uncharacterized protein n=1 Tax=Lichtheimia corymbifera JMRC:FSU:9682 TaxID=1263082 RepID=A0A068SD88_9FUNG|nr:predicted protein [Lichtheimia corymbifera JMRC:FSU:9682]
MKRDAFHRTKLLSWVESIYCGSFTIVVANPSFRNVASSLKKFKRSTLDPVWRVVTLGESEIVHDDRETSTQGALHLAAQLCSIEDPTFHCRIFSYGHLHVFHMLCKRDAI